jgi:hypothetical protein
MRPRGQESAWNEFTAWCRLRRLRALPAHPWTVAAYIRWCETRLHYASIVARVRAIARAHLLACADSPDRHPTVERTLKSVEARERRRQNTSALFPPDATEATEPSAADQPRVAATPGRIMRTLPPLVRRRPAAGR